MTRERNFLKTWLLKSTGKKKIPDCCSKWQLVQVEKKDGV